MSERQLKFSQAGLLPNSFKIVNHHVLLCIMYNIIKTKSISLLLAYTRYRLRCVEVVYYELCVVATPFAGPKGLFQTLVLANVSLSVVASRESEKYTYFYF